jgi:hypothetical protein
LMVSALAAGAANSQSAEKRGPMRNFMLSSH